MERNVGKKQADDFTDLALSYQQILEDQTPLKDHKKKDENYTREDTN